MCTEGVAGGGKKGKKGRETSRCVQNKTPGKQTNGAESKAADESQER